MTEKYSPPPRNQHSAPMEPLAEIPPARPVDGTFVSIPEIADIAGVKVKTVEQWRNRRRIRDVPFVEPDDYFGTFPGWRVERVEAWLKATGRPYDLSAWKAKRNAGEYRRKIQD